MKADIVLIDGSSFLYRVSSKITSQFAILERTLDAISRFLFGGRTFICIFESGSPGKRRELHPLYKRKRYAISPFVGPETVEILAELVETRFPTRKGFSFIVEDAEGDDAISYLVHMLSAKGERVGIVSSDFDYLQFVGEVENVFVEMVTTNVLMTKYPENISETVDCREKLFQMFFRSKNRKPTNPHLLSYVMRKNFTLRGADILLFKVLCGDRSDGVKGICSLSEFLTITILAKKLFPNIPFREYVFSVLDPSFLKDAEDFYENITGRRRSFAEKILEAEETFILNYKLTCLLEKGIVCENLGGKNIEKLKAKMKEGNSPKGKFTRYLRVWNELMRIGDADFLLP